MTLTYQKKEIDGVLSLEGKLSLDSLEFFQDDTYQIRMALEWGLENEFFNDRTQRLAFYGNVGDGKFSTWKIVNPFTGHKTGLADYRWWCAIPPDDPTYVDRDNILTLIELKESLIDKTNRKISLTFTMPIKRGYFNMPENGVYRMAMSWGIFPSSQSNDKSYVRGQTEPAKTWSLEYMALPDHLLEKYEQETLIPKTHVFILGKSQPFGPLFPDPYFMEELEISILVMYLCSISTITGILPFLVISFFMTLYNGWSIYYGIYQLFAVDGSDPL